MAKNVPVLTKWIRIKPIAKIESKLNEIKHTKSINFTSDRNVEHGREKKLDESMRRHQTTISKNVRDWIDVMSKWRCIHLKPQ